ncbi:Uncharacterised protein [Sphingobacterium spiritivorum]|nr:Uncharacterised protein [Sphingobacterium spiritivorum]
MLLSYTEQQEKASSDIKKLRTEKNIQEYKSCEGLTR